MTDLAIPFGASGGFGDTFTGWAMQDPDKNAQANRYNALNALGNEVASALGEIKTSVTSNYVATANTCWANIPPRLGAVIAGIVLESIAIGTNEQGFATMALSGHFHAANTHADGTLQEFEHGIGAIADTANPAIGFCFLEGEDSNNIASVESSTITATCDHVDVGGAVHLAGENHNARLEASTTWHGTVDTLAAAGWDVTGNQEQTGNNKFKSHTITGTKALALYVAP
jgi:hypothetical protein